MRTSRTKSAKAPAPWHERAVCAGAEHDYWAGDNAHDIAEARRICRNCPVLADCFEDALKSEARSERARRGVRAALTGPQRSATARDQRELGRLDADFARRLALDCERTPERTASVAEAAGAGPATARLARRMLGRPPLLAAGVSQQEDRMDGLLAQADGLVFSVREEAPGEVASRLRAVPAGDLEALVVVLASLVDAEFTPAEALAWTERDAGPDPSDEEFEPATGVDEAAVLRAVEGEQLPLDRATRRAAVVRAMSTTWMSPEGVGQTLGMSPTAVEKAWVRAQKAASKAGHDVPLRPTAAEI